MGYVRHDAILVTDYGYDRAPDVEAFRDSLPEDWRALVVGPIEAVINRYVTYAFLPDGSKEGWDDSNAGDEYRRQFLELFSKRYSDGSSPYEIVSVRYGNDREFEPEVIVNYGDGKQLTSAPTEDSEEQL